MSRIAEPIPGVHVSPPTVFYAIRNRRVSDGLIRRAGAEFAYMDRVGRWIGRPALIDKVKEWNVDPVGPAEAAAIAASRGGSI